MKRFIALALASVMVACTFAGCGGNGSNGGASRPIKICVGSEPKSIDPAINQAVDGSIYLCHLFEGLTTSDKDNKTVGGVAEKWEISDDQLTYTFHLRKDAKWSDGQAVKASDFVYAWQRAVNPATASAYAYQLYYIKNAEAINSQNIGEDGQPAKVKVDAKGAPVTDKDGKMTADDNGKFVSAKDDGSAVWLDDLGVKATDDNTLVVTLEAPCAYFLQIAGFPTLYPVRKDIVEKNPDNWATDPSTYVCNGPYILKSWEHNSKIVLTPNTNYWNKANMAGQDIECMLMDDTNSIIAAFKNGELDLAEDVPPDELQTLVKSGDAQIYDNLAIGYFDVNCQVAPMNNAKVRAALSLAIDRNYLVESILKGGQKPAGSMVPYGIKDADGKDFRENAGEYIDVSKDKLNDNIAKAKSLLAEAGYPDGKGFPNCTIKFNTGASNQKLAEYLQSEWKKNLGVNINLAQEEWSVFIADRNNGKFEIARDGWSADYEDPMTFLDMFVTNGGNNNSKYKNADYDALIKTAKSTGDQATRMKAMHDAESLFMNENGAIPLYYYTNPDLVSKKLQGYVSSSMGYKYLMWAKIAE